MLQESRSFEAELEQRLALASKSENMGEELRTIDYVLLLFVTVAVPAVLMITGWYL